MVAFHSDQNRSIRLDDWPGVHFEAQFMVGLVCVPQRASHRVEGPVEPPLVQEWAEFVRLGSRL